MNMKKIIGCVLVGIVLLVSCSKSEDVAKSEDIAKADGVTMRLITDKTGVSDKSFNASAWEGIVDFYGDTVEKTPNRGTYYDIVTCPTQDTYTSVIKSTADQEYDLICMNGFSFADVLSQVAPLYPDQKFMIADVNWLSGDNIMQVSFAEQEGSFLVGALVALKAIEDGIESPKFGFIGGIPGRILTKFEMGYIQGIKSVLPNAEIVDYYANDWGKPELAKTQAKNWFDSGVYAIFSAAGGTGSGTIAQAKEYRMQGKNVWAIGVDSDQYEDGLYSDDESAVLTSMVKRVSMATKYALNAVKNGTFKGEMITLDLAKDGLGFSVKNKAVSQSIIDKVNANKKDIIDGKIKVYGTYFETLNAGLVSADLGAKDD